MYKRKASWLKHLDFMILDVICLIFAYTLSYMIRHNSGIPYGDLLYQRMCMILAIVSVMAGGLLENYKNILQRGYYKEFRAVFQHVVIVAGGVLAYMFFVKASASYSRIAYGQLFVIGSVFIYAERILWKNLIRKRVAKSRSLPRVLVVADKVSMEKCLKTLLGKKYTSYRLVGCVVYDADLAGTVICGVPVVCSFDEIISYARKNILDEMLIQPSGHEEEFENVIQEFIRMGITVHIGVSRIFGNLPNKTTGKFGDYAVLTSTIQKVRIRQLFIKRLMDIGGSIAGLCITGIALIIVGAIIKIQSPGPVFFSQTRVGKNGRKFRIYKFRSMYLDAETRKKELMEQNKMQGFMFKMDDDPRITPIGKFIRKTSIDELPQFWNILKGDMSLVGTRPPTVDEFEQYDTHHRVRLSIKPGLTGLWQVSGRSDIVDFEEVVKLDEQYIREWNLGLDIKILWQTVLVVLRGQGSV